MVDALDFPDELLQKLRRAQHVAVLTGAGVSAESGVPTFREAQTGLWARYDPEELATAGAFRRNPKRVWDWYTWRRELVERAEPNPGHVALAQLESLAPRVTLITQNVDGLHERAGSNHLVELHGNILRSRCFSEGTNYDSWGDVEDTPPRCPRCGDWLRPDVVWFGEALPRAALQAAFDAAQSCDLFFAIGTSALVQPAASLPVAALEQGAMTVEINTQETPLTRWMDFALKGQAGVVLPALLRAAWPANE